MLHHTCCCFTARYPPIYLSLPPFASHPSMQWHVRDHLTPYVLTGARVFLMARHITRFASQYITCFTFLSASLAALSTAWAAFRNSAFVLLSAIFSSLSNWVILEVSTGDLNQGVTLSRATTGDPIVPVSRPRGPSVYP